MREIACDVAVIGAGTAGLAARAAAEREGARTLLIESGPYGTTCARVGCMPSKLLIEAAKAAHAIARSEIFGLRPGRLDVDGPTVLARVRRERDRFVEAVVEETLRIPAETRLHGPARFLDPLTLAVGDHVRVRARAVVVATGARATVPEVLREIPDRVVTTDTLFELEDLPASLAVLGAGAVGLEMAQAMARLGVRVAVFDPGETVGGLKDAEVNAAALRAIGGEMPIHLGGEVEGARRTQDGVRLAWRDGEGRPHENEFAMVLAAAGRPPRLDGLGLDRAGVACGESGVPRFDPRSRQCEGTAVFIAGDAATDRPVLHEASRQGEIAGRNAARHPDVSAPPRWPSFAIVFTDPGLASVGEPAPEGGRTIRVGFEDQGRARAMARNVGLLAIHADAEGRLVGAEMAVPEAEHLAHLLAWAIDGAATIPQLAERPFYHPTLEEGLRTALREWAPGRS